MSHQDRSSDLKFKLSVPLIIGFLLSFSGNKVLARSSPNEFPETKNSSKYNNLFRLNSTEVFKPNLQSRSLLFLGGKTVILKIPNSNLAQLPNPITPKPPQQKTPIPRTLPENPLQVPPTQVPSPQEKPDIPGTVTVKRFEFKGNSEKVFSDEQLRKETKQYLDRPLTFAELLQIENIITQLYTDAGYINSGAFIPANQAFSLKGAVVKVQIVEGGVEDIKVTGTQRLNANYVRDRIALATEKPLNRFRLLEALQLLQLDPLISNLSTELSAGSRPELSLLEIKVKEADSFNLEAFADNGRTPSVGSFRRGLNLNQNNLFGFGDGLNLKYTNTDGSNALDASYKIPLNARNGTLTLAGGFSDTEVIEKPFDRIDITGDSHYFELGFRQPIIQKPTQEFSLGLTASRQESKTKLRGERFPLSPGASDDGETKISAVRFFQEYTQRSPQDVFAVRSQFSLGVDAFDATVNKTAPDGRFFSWRGQGQYVRLLAPETLLVVRSDVQLASRTLVPLEQFSIGGFQNVRGYRQDVLLTDNGVFASAEVQLPIFRVEEVKGVFHLVPFVDFGVGWNISGTPDPQQDTLVGLGLGLQWQMGDKFNARFDWGIPLTEVEDRDGKTLQEDGLYFSVNYSPF